MTTTLKLGRVASAAASWLSDGSCTLDFVTGEVWEIRAPRFIKTTAKPTGSQIDVLRAPRCLSVAALVAEREIVARKYQEAQVNELESRDWCLGFWSGYWKRKATALRERLGAIDRDLEQRPADNIVLTKGGLVND